MLDFRHTFLEVMDSIDAAKSKRHLISPEQFSEKYQGKPEFKSALIGRTTHPYFELLPDGHMIYRIKSGVSASEAIESLLVSHETLIECGVALAIAYNLVVLRMMQKHHGNEEGRKRFDRLFGEKDKETPEHRRLVVSIFSVIMGTEALPRIGVLPVQPLSFFIDQIPFKTMKDLYAFPAIGAQIIFSGDPNYCRIHPAGTHGAYNCVVSSLNPLKVRSTGAAGKEISEEELYQIHVTEFAKPPSFQSVSMYEPGFLQSAELNQLIKQGPQKSHIKGFMPVLFAINQNKFAMILDMEIEEIIHRMDVYLLETKLRCLQENLVVNPQEAEFLANAFAKLRISPTKIEQHRNQAASSAKEFAGLTGLAGAFTAKPKPQKSKPAAAFATKPAVTEEPFLPAFAKGFLDPQQTPKTPKPAAPTATDKKYVKH